MKNRHVKGMMIALGCMLAVGFVSTNADAWTCTHQDWKASECCPLHPDDSYCQPNGGQKQGQGQGQGQGQIATGGNSRAQGGKGGNVSDSGNSSNANLNRATGGSVGDTSSASSASNEGNTTSVDTSDHGTYNDTSNVQFLPPVVPSTPPSVVGVGNIVVDRSPCGPRQVVVSEQITGYSKNPFRTSEVKNGLNDRTATAELGGMPDPFLHYPLDDGSVLLIGSQVVTFAAVIGNSSASSLAIGGGSGSGNWGQAGGGSSGGLTQIQTRTEIQDCVFAREGAKTSSAPVIQEVPQKHVRQ